jgi:hypothetical protein
MQRISSYFDSFDPFTVLLLPWSFSVLINFHAIHFAEEQVKKSSAGNEVDETISPKRR